MRSPLSFLLALLVITPALYAQDDPALVEIGTNDFRISDIGPDGSNSFGVFSTGVAYNPNANEYLVVFSGDEADGEFEIYGQRLNAATGAEVGPNDFRISTTGPEGDPNYDAGNPSVVYNPTNDEYLVVWEALDPPQVSTSEVYGQRLAADGTELGTDFRISDAGPEGAMFFRVFAPVVVHNPTANEYLVVWSGDDGETVDALDREIRGQRLDATTGSEVGPNDFRISDLGPDGNSQFFYGARNPSVAYNPVTDEYLVVWEGGDDNVPPDFTTEEEVFGQRLDAATGTEVGPNDFRISDVGPNGSVIEYQVNGPDVVYNDRTNEYFVVWAGDYVVGDTNRGGEVFGQRLDAAGGEIGTNDIKLSDVGPDNTSQRGAVFPSVTTDGEVYLVVWGADDEAAGLSVFEYEIFGQLVDASTGTEIGPNDVLLSDANPGTTQGEATTADLVYNTVNGEYLAVWHQSVPAPAPFELEAFGQRLAVEGLGADVTVSVAPTGPPVVIPPQGGSFDFTITLANTSVTAQTFDVWTAASGPVNRNPVMGPRTVTLPPGATVTRTLMQQVPAAAPAGLYTYTANVGSFPATVDASDSFPAAKQAGQAAPGAGSVADWGVRGWDEAAAGRAMPEGVALLAVYPNPFVRAATVRYALPAAGRVRLVLYDLLGREVVVLLSELQEAGTHEAMLEGAALSNGMYLVQLEAEGQIQTQKVMLLR